MAAAQNKVEYSFTGDVSSLKQATEGALKLLDQYQNKIKALSDANAYKPNTTAANAMKSALSDTMREVDQLQKKFRSVQDIQIFKGSPASAQLTAAMQNLQTNLNRFNATSIATTSTVQSLVQSVNAAKQSFQDVAPAVDAMVLKEQKFQAVLESVQQRSEMMADKLRSLFGAIGQSTDVVSSKLSAFKAKAAEALNNLGRLVAAAIGPFKQLMSAEDADTASLQRFSSAVRDASAGMGNAQNAANKKSKALKEETDQTKKDTQSTNKLAAALKAFAKVTKTVFTALLKAANVLKNIKKSFDAIKSSTSGISSELKGLATVLAGLKIGQMLSNATKEAIGFIENLNLFTVAMGDSVEEGLKFVNTMSEIYGMDPSNLYRYAGYFYSLTDAIGMTDQASKNISLSLTKAANDKGSLFNVEIEQVVNNLASGMQGMSMAVRKYGIDIRQATLQQTALNYGFTENVSKTSEANRQALRFLTIMDQVKNATRQVTETVDGANKVMGDFARNIETPANQLRILKEQVTQVARAIGNFFIPIMQRALYVINGFLMALKILLQFIASLLGIDISGFGGAVSKGASAAKDAASAVGDIGDAAADSAKKMKKLIAPFDELTILTQDHSKSGKDSGLGGLGDGLDPRLLDAIEAMSLGLDEIRMKALDVRDKILELLGLELDEDGNILVTAGGFIDDLMHLWDDKDYRGFGRRIAEFLNQGIEWGINATDPSKWSPILNEKVRILAEILNGLVEGLNWRGLGTILGNGFTIALGMINTFLETFDWYQLGSELGEGFMGLIDAVDWDLFGRTIGNYFMSKIRMVNGFIESVDWHAFGDKLGQGLNSIIATVNWNELGIFFANQVNALFDTLHGIFRTFNWAELGASLGNGLMTMLNTIRWEHIGTTFASFINGLITTARNFLDTYEWGTFGSKIAAGFSTAVREIDWKGLARVLSDTLKMLLTELIRLIGEIDWYSLGKAITDFILNIDWLGLFVKLLEAVIVILGAAIQLVIGIIAGLFENVGDWVVKGMQSGIMQGLADIFNWLNEHFVKPIVDAVKSLLGIASPSKVFIEIGKFVVEGLKQGILEIIRGIGGWIKESFIDPIVTKVKGFFGINGSGSTVFSDIGKQLLNGLFSGLGNIGSKIATWGKNILNKVKGVFGIHSPSKEFEGIGNYMTEGLLNGLENTKQIQQNYQGMLTNMQTYTSSFTENATSAFQHMSTATSELLEATSTQQQSLANETISAYSSMASQSVSHIQQIANALNTIPKKVSTTHTITTSNVVNNATVNMKKMASGGVVTGPTRALIGEGRYDEAVIPLGNSPQMEDLVDKIAKAVSATPRNNVSNQPIEVRVFLEGSEITSYQNRTNRMYGRTQQII